MLTLPDLSKRLTEDEAIFLKLFKTLLSAAQKELKSSLSLNLARSLSKVRTKTKDELRTDSASLPEKALNKSFSFITPPFSFKIFLSKEAYFSTSGFGTVLDNWASENSSICLTLSLVML